MVRIFTIDGWKIGIDKFNPKNKRLMESIFSLGNGHMGLRGFFEEEYSGDSLHGTYLAGVYYPDKTKVGWWKNGYNDSFAKVVNSTNWIGIDININGQPLDLAKWKINDFSMTLDMKIGLLSRNVTAEAPTGEKLSFEFKRFLSMARRNIACVYVSVKPLNFSGNVTFLPYLDGDVVNEDANYEEKFWKEIDKRIDTENKRMSVTMETLKTGYRQSTAAFSLVKYNGKELSTEKTPIIKNNSYVGQRISVSVNNGDTVTIEKYVAVCTSRDFEKDNLEETATQKLNDALKTGYDELFKEHCVALDNKWNECDVLIDGDVQAQQGIRYNIFQLNQTYTGDDPRLNLGPKGFTGEKYGGSTYWDTEAFCLPFYLYTNSEIARNLLYYRYLQLDKARGNARKLGLSGALYPMVTMDGEECHNEWEITFEELHRNGAMAYAVYNYTNYTGDKTYLDDYGIEELAEISRFWASRVNYNPTKDKYMMLCVTGPNEYENNINNNWYTNTLAAWTMDYTRECLFDLKTRKPERYNSLISKISLSDAEIEKWKEISSKMHFPFVKELGIFEQQDLYMDKEQKLVQDIPENELPLNKHWSWDKILRSCFIKQADVIQAFYFFPQKYDKECKKRNFDFYEPRTVHESSLSPSVYSIVASQIGYKEKAYELYLRTSRLDLDNYNDDTDDGVHLTSMSGSWLAIVQGFAGVYVENDILTLNPFIPEQWKCYSFKMNFRGSKIKISVSTGKVNIELLNDKPLKILAYDKEYTVNDSLTIDMP